MTEPTGSTIDGTPWEEPRPPHLPDRLTALSPWVAPFVLVALYQVWLLWADRPLAEEPALHANYWLDALRYQSMGIVASLLGAALFVRHPDARATLPRLATGVFLVLLQQILHLLQPSLDPIFVAITPPSDDLAFFSPAAQAYAVLTSAVGILGVAVIASGLAAARRFEDRVPGRRLVLAVTVATIISSVISIGAFATVGFDASPGTIVSIFGSWLLDIFRTLAWGYLFAVTLGGVLGREAPGRGWVIAALGAGLAWLYVLAWPALALALGQELFVSVLQVLAFGYFAGSALLVVAFLVGLPSTESVPDDLEFEPTTDPPGATLPGSAAG